MFEPTQTLTSFAVDDIPAAVTFYGETLGLKVTAAQGVLLLHHPDGHATLVYPKPDHIPASYTVLNFVVDDVDDAVDELRARDVRLLRYDDLGADDKGIVRHPDRDIAWFPDPAGNIHSVARLKTPLPQRPAWTAQDRTQTGVAVLFATPVILLAGLAAHPFVHNYFDGGVSLAAAVAAAPSRWASSRLLIALGLGLVLVAATIIRHRLRDAGEQRWSVAALGLLLVGGTLLGAVVGSEVTLAAVATSGQDVLATLEAGEHTAAPLYLGGALPFATGWLCLAVALHRTPNPAARAHVAGEYRSRRCSGRTVRPPDLGDLRLRRRPRRGQLADRLQHARRQGPRSRDSCPTDPRTGLNRGPAGDSHQSLATNTAQRPRAGRPSAALAG
jgi:catechol 2,3-dioxygenase-like lactoylglutathione lyase family enzyme